MYSQRKRIICYLKNLIHVFKSTIHSLSEERHYGVGSVSKQHHPSLVIPLGRAHCAQESVGVVNHLGGGQLHTPNERNRLKVTLKKWPFQLLAYIAVVLIEELLRCFRIFQLGEAGTGNGVSVNPQLKKAECKPAPVHIHIQRSGHGAVLVG